MPRPSTRAVLLALSLVACSAAPPSPSDPAHLAAQGAEPSFSAMRSTAILAAAMTYPVLKVAEEPPLSLTTSDGTGLKLASLEARAVVEGPLAFTEIHLRFDNPEDRVIEGRFAVTLPPGAAVSRLAMRSPEGWQEAEVVERQLARRAYEDALHRRQDPALLEKEAGNEFRARIFPIPARASKDIVISYSQEIRTGQPYRLPLRGLPEVGRVHVSALVGQNKTELDRKGWKPDSDFEVATPASIAGLRDDDLVVARVRPDLGADRAKISDLVVLFDTSASRALGFAREVERLGQLVATLGKDAGPDAKLTVATFDQTVDPVYRGSFAGFSKKQLDAVLARRPLGASDLGAAIAWLGRSDKGARAVLLTDAIATAGSADAAANAARGLRGTVDRLDVVLTGGIRDEDLARRIARGTVEKDGVVLDGSLEIAEIARRITLGTRSGIAVQVPGAVWSWPETIDGVQPGDETLVYARLGKGSLAAGKPLSVVLSGALAQRLDVALSPAPRPLLERAAAGAEIARIAAGRERLAPEDTAKRDAHLREIVRISTKYRVVSDFTALLVLETEMDYQRFGIDRRALADILTVGERGIDVIHRSAPVVAVKEPPPQPVAKKPEPTKGRPRNGHAPPAPPRPAEKMKKMANGDGAPPAQKPKPPADESPRPPMAQRAPAPEPDLADKDGKLEEAPQGAASAAPQSPPAPRSAERRAPAGAPGPVPAAEAPAPPPPPPAAGAAPPRPAGDMDLRGMRADRRADDEEQEPSGPPPYSGKMADVMNLVADRKIEAAVVEALRWQTEDPGDVLALVALGEALEAAGNAPLAARAYGSILDLFPARADMRRFASERLERLGAAGGRLASDAYAKAVADRPDHLHGHRLLAYALVREGRVDAAFSALEAGLSRSYPGGRFLGGDRILREDLGLVAAVWLAKEPNRRAEIERRLAPFRAEIATSPSLRFVLVWETDANDVDFHIRDGKGGHASYRAKQLPSGGELYADVTTGYGPECFTIEGTPQAYPYRLQIHYYSRGPMGYGMGKLEVVEHDGKGGLVFEERPFVVMNDHAFVDLGEVRGPLAGKR